MTLLIFWPSMTSTAEAFHSCRNVSENQKKDQKAGLTPTVRQMAAMRSPYVMFLSFMVARSLGLDIEEPCLWR